MFVEDFARERERQAAEQRATEQHEQYIEQMLSAKDAEIERARDAGRAYRGLLWRLQDKNLLPPWASTELGLLESRHDAAIDPDDEDVDGAAS